MRKPAKTRLVGTFAATALLAPWCGAATSQTTGASQVLNNQLQLGEVLAGETLDVVEATDSTSAISVATGNGLSGSAWGRDLNVRSTQEVRGSVEAGSIVNVERGLGANAYVSSAGTGNTGDININNATMTAVVTQSASMPALSSYAQVNGETATAGNTTVSAQTVANSQGFGLVNGSVGARVIQWSDTGVIANGGANIGAANGTTVVTANAAGNNVTSNGDGQSAQRLVVGQENYGDKVEANMAATYGFGYVTSTSAMAQGNTLHATNQGPLLDVTANQTNSAYVLGQAETKANTYSSSETTGYAAGNSVLAGNLGAEIVLDNRQFNNGGGVEVVVNSDLGTGWDSSATATAYGNAATAYVCSSCSGKMTVNNNQTNDAAVGASVSARTGYGRSVSGISTAVGNNASFYVSAPSGSK